MCGKIKFHSKAPTLKYRQDLLNSCCFSSLESAFAIINQGKSENSTAMRIEESLTSDVGNCIDFEDDILKNEKNIEVEQKMYYSLRKYKTMVSFYICTYISEICILVQLMDYLGNLNHAISVVGYWIFDSNYENALVLNRESLDMICDPYVGEKQEATFERVLCSVIFTCSRSHPKKE